MSESAIQERLCPHCGSSIPIGATICPYCTRRVINHTECPECKEIIAKDAKYCPWCTQRIRKYVTGTKAELPPLDIAIRAARWGQCVRHYSPTALIRPLCIHANRDRIAISRWAAAGIDRQDESVDLSTVARIERKTGWFWSMIEIQLKDDDANEPMQIRGLPKREAKIFAHRVNAEIARL